MLENNISSSAPGRYLHEKIQDYGQTYFVKTALQPEVIPLLEREVIWGDFMRAVASEYPDLNVRSPQIQKVKGPQIVFEYIDAPFVANREDITTLEPKVPRLVDTLLAMDDVGATWRSSRGVSQSSDHAPYQQIDKRWQVWSERPLKAGILTPDMLAKAQEIVDSHRQYLTPRMQHGDFVPWHIFEKGEEWIIYDGEHASDQKPRFYDLAYTYTRIFTYTKRPDLAGSILQQFMDKSGLDQDEFFKAFLPVVTSRAIGMFLDALNDKDKVDYVADTQKLFKRCTAGQLSAFTS